MKYFISIFLSIFLLFNIAFKMSPTYVYSAPADDFTAGIGCGLLNNQCCEEPKKIKIDLPKLPIPVLGWVIDKILSPVEGIINSTLSPIINKVSELTLEKIIGVDIGSDNYKCVEGKPIKSGNVCTCLKEMPNSFEQMCLNIKNPNEKAKCISCVGSANCYWSGIGSIYTDLPSFINKNLFGIFLSFAGVLTLLCIIYSAFILQTSSGNPERIKKARQNLTSCITGLLVIIFSIFILRVIGGDIIKIPGIG